MVYLAGLLPVLIAGIPWTLKAILGVAILVIGYLNDKKYGERGSLLPLKLVYDDSEPKQREKNKTQRARRRGWRLRRADAPDGLDGLDGLDAPWRDMELVTHFNFLDIALLLIFREKEPGIASVKSGMSLFRLFKKKRPSLCLPFLLGDLSAEELRVLRMLARFAD